PVRSCSHGACRQLSGTLILESYVLHRGASGRLEVNGPAGSMPSAVFQADWCDWAASLAPSTATPPLGRNRRLHEIAAFQAVKVSLMFRGSDVLERRVRVVADRELMLRAYVVPTEGWHAREVLAQLTLHGLDDLGKPLPATVLKRIVWISEASSEGSLLSTINFDVPAELVREDTSYSIELREIDACAAPEGTSERSRYPETGSA